MTTPDMERAAVTEHRLNKLEDAVHEINQSFRMLVRLEERHVEMSAGLGRAFKSIEKLGERVEVMEKEMPTLKLTRGWVIMFAIGCATLLLLAVAKLVFPH